MRHLAENLRGLLERDFGNRVTFDYMERRLYGHDIASMPRLVKPLIGDTTPHAVVQPSSEEEVVDLVRWARDNDLPLVARGKATSGYGGVLPIAGGVVVDFWRMKSVLEVGDETVIVEPGISWEQLDRALAEQGRTLRVPASFSPDTLIYNRLHRGRLARPGWRRYR
jgi:FAD/FMN-containing dehydrogenase